MPASGHPYRNQRIALATIHRKERAVAPAFRRVLGAEVVVAAGVDTDSLGTFSGEIQRKADLVETALLKAEMAFAATDVECAIASEGSYGPIERVPFEPSGLEIMSFIDRKRGVRVVETLVTRRTNWRIGRYRAGDPAVPDVVRALGFPEFGTFVIANSDPSRPVKDLASIAEVVAAVDREAARSADGLAVLIADMRAHRNPTRMKVLRALAWKLARRLENVCRKCHAPGFGPIGSQRGLPCEDCGAPTHWVACEVHGCSACGHALGHLRKDGRRTAPKLSCKVCG